MLYVIDERASRFQLLHKTRIRLTSYSHVKAWKLGNNGPTFRGRVKGFTFLYIPKDSLLMDV